MIRLSHTPTAPLPGVARTEDRHWRVLNAIRKMFPGTMGGESQVANPPSQNSNSTIAQR